MAVRTAHAAGAFVLWWIEAGDRADAEAGLRGLTECARQHGRKPHYVSVVCRASRPPTSEGRKGILATVPEVMASCEHLHVVLEGRPFVNSVTRGMVVAAGLMPTFRGRVTVYDSLREALFNVASITGNRTLPDTIEAQYPDEYLRDDDAA